MITQLGIMIFGAGAIYLVGRKDKWKRYGYILGLLGQPFWYYETISNEQWGIFLMTLVYTYSWGNGLWNYWFYKSKVVEIDRGVKIINAYDLNNKR